MKDPKDESLALSMAFAALLALLALTVWASRVWPSSVTGTVIALAIAATKAGLILFFFMGLRKDSGELRLIAVSAAFWLFALFLLTSTDYLTRGDLGVLGK